MSTPILTTKLYIPPARPELVSRARLLERLNGGLRRRSGVTLISAPAGFGKTTLVSEWIHQNNESEENTLHHSSFIIHPSRVAWLSLDDGDNDPTRFLAYLVAALRTPAWNEIEEIAPKIGSEVMAALQSPQPPSLESMLTTLLNDIAAIPDDFVLVLDDYHVIEAEAVDQIVTFLLDHPPPQMHLVIATREDPNLPLPRLRVRGQLTELRAADLRFTPDETAGFLNQVMGLNLSAKNIAALETRTEGWIAGLQMAALSMQGRADTAGFIRAFTGSHRFVLDYLVEEVLQRQPEPVRSFLLQTAILTQLNGSLCDAVVGRLETSDWRLERDAQAATNLQPPITNYQSPITNLQSQKILEYLEHANLFVVPLDDERQWYRYHHLFADVLQAHILDEQPDQVPTLHRRASVWHEENGLPADAVRHALAAKDFERAAGLIELLSAAKDTVFLSAMWLGWVRALPDEIVRVRPVLSVAYAWTLLGGGEMEAGEARLRDAERCLASTIDTGGQQEDSSSEMVVVDEAKFQTLPGSMASARAYHAQAIGDVTGTIKYARQALDLLPEDDHILRGPPAALLGIAQWASGDLEAAYQTLTTVMANFQKVGHISYAISGSYGLADIRMVQGRLYDAIKLYKQSLQLVAEQNQPTLQGTADLYLGLGQLYYEQGNQAAAREHLQKSEELSKQAALPDWPYRACLVRARIKKSEGELNGALDLLAEAERLYYRSPIPMVRPVAAQKTRVWIEQNRLSEAQGWVREQGLTVDDDLSFLREFEHITLARVLMVQYGNDQRDDSIEEALRLLSRLLQAAEAGGRNGSAIEILMLQALARQAQDDIAAALVSLEQALTLAEAEGYVRIFVDEGEPMAALLREAVKHSSLPNYVGRLQTAFESIEGKVPTTPLLIEPLSDRELDVLKLLNTELSGPEIARELMVSLNTLRTHTKNIYTKLGVNNRRTAVRRAEELGLL
ncbi:MAG: tetratricopeptide repeat protein [Anaerolineae bacterium]|nr:tetratricopeptide repeat protein [Anaerolineae bacterium]